MANKFLNKNSRWKSPKVIWIVVFSIFALKILDLGLTMWKQRSGDDLQKSLSEVPDQPSYYKHIAPIISRSCWRCHRVNGIAPFSLESFEQVRKKAKTIAKVTSKRIMPPWPADPNYSHFVGENVLSEIEIQTIAKWVEQGAKEGNPSDFIAPQQIHDRSVIGKPDWVIPVPPIALKNDGYDQFYLTKTHVKLPEGKYIAALEFVPKQPDLLHHANGHLILYPNGRADLKNGDMRTVNITPGNYKEDFKHLDVLNKDGSQPERIHSAVNYLPGVQGVKYPDGIGGFYVPKEFALSFVDLHFGPSDRNVTDSSLVNVFFTDKKPERPTFEINLGTDGVGKIQPPLVIPPNQITKHKVEYVIEAPISVLTINPHLHLLGKSFLAFAIKPNGDTVRLISIPRWNFRWQYFYTFKKIQVLPAGSKIVAIAEFDNTVNNINNPNKPPKQVSERWEDGGNSMRASDEMFQFIITYISYRPGDENISLESKK